jgi:hypothetical protein
MKALLSGIALTAVVVTSPAWAQVSSGSPGASMQNQAANTQNSQPGVPGKPGSKSGPTVEPNGQVTGQQQTPDARLHDPSGVRGLPGSKSGPAVTPPSKSQ